MKLLIAINKPKDISIILTLCTLSSKVFTIKNIPVRNEQICSRSATDLF